MVVDVLETPPLDGGGEVAGRRCEPAEPLRSGSAAAPVIDQARLRRIVTEDYGFLWRCLRRLGVSEADADDGAQRALGVLAHRLPDVARGAERSFLFQTALRVASEMRRSQRRSRLVLGDDEARHEPVDEAPGPDVALEQREARALLDEALEALDLDLAAVFILFDLEELTTAEIAGVLGIPPGTVSTRLRKAHEEFKKIVSRLRARQAAVRRKR
jgi:RNA polymerase sigma-70 factor, ECF subfamily